MSDLNVQNRAVWFDVPVADVDRAIDFYAAVLGIRVHKESFQGTPFAVLEHQDGNGGCLIPRPEEVSAAGILVYFNVDGRIRAAVREAQKGGGMVVQDVHGIGPHGFRAIVLDSEGNRIALHSNSDA